MASRGIFGASRFIGLGGFGRSAPLMMALAMLVACEPAPDAGNPEAQRAHRPAEVFGVTGPPRLMAQLGHSGQIRAVAFSPDGKTVVTGSKDGTARLWDKATGKELQRFEGHSSPVMAVAFAPDGRSVLTGSLDDSARLWDAATGRELQRFEGHSNPVIGVVFAPDGRTVLTGSGDKTARLWEVATGRELRRFEGHSHLVSAVAFSPDGRTALTGSGDKTARLWEVATGRELRRFAGHSDTVSAVAFSPDGRTILTAGSWDRTARLWDVAIGRESRRFEGHSFYVSAVGFAPDGRSVLTGSHGKMQLWDVATGWELRAWGGYAGSVEAVAFSPDGRSVLAAGESSYSTEFSNVPRLWDVATGRELQRFEGHSASVAEVAFSPDGRSVLTGSYDRTARLWDMTTGREVRRFEGHTGPVSGIAVSPDGQSVLTSSRLDQTARLWDVATGKMVRQFGGHFDRVWAVAFSLDGRRVLTGGDDTTAHLWDVATARELRRFKGQIQGEGSAPFWAVTFAPDGRFVLTGCPDSTARLWDPSMGREVRRFKGHLSPVMAVAFSPDSRTALTGSQDQTARLWDVGRGLELRRFEGHSGAVMAVASSPDGHSILTGSSDQSARLWDAATGRVLRRFEGHTASVSGVAFSPDGRTVLTGSDDGTSRLWNAETGEELAQLISFKDGTWAVVDKDGRFDASNGGDVQGLHWVVGLEPIALSQLKERYYEPGLLAKKLGFNREPLRDVAAFTNPKLYPEVEVQPPDPNRLELGITLKNRGGGIGRVVVAINGKEAKADARGEAPNPDVPSLRLQVPLSGHPYLLPGQSNTVEVRAYNAEGYLSSRGVSVDFQAPGQAPTEKPALWALVAGISDYAGETLDLRYAAKDAEDMAKALELGAKRLFGAERVNRFLLTSAPVPGARPATKAEFKKVYQEMEKAQPQDILVVYLAGHGVAYQDNYYYLTQDARSAELTDPEVRQRAAVSTEELVRWITKTPALKQVMVLDTCQAGTLEAKLIEKRDISSDQIRALERLKDRTGFHVLMGSAADAVSYEATRFQQGLLTYALLEGMKGKALREDAFVDVSRLFQHAADQVPLLAGQVGGIQRPRIAAPRGGTSFDIGQLSPEDRRLIPLAQSKPLLLRPVFFNPEQGYDDLELTAKVRQRLREASYAGSRGAGALPQVVYTDAEEFPGAIRPSGAYHTHGPKLSVTVVLVRDQKKLQQLRVEGSTEELDTLAGRIVTEIDRAAGAVKN